MEPHRIAAAGTVVLIVGVTIASGPLVGLSLTSDAEEFEPSQGTLNATFVSTPENATLEAAKYGIDEYHLRASPVELGIHDITGQPTVAYDLVIHELNYTRSSITFLDSSFTGSFQLEFEPTTLDAGRIDREEYSGTISVVVLNGEDGRTLAKTDIRIGVHE